MYSIVKKCGVPYRARPAPSATTARCLAVLRRAPTTAQNAMRDQIRSATTVISLATMLHTIATGNMTPSLPRAAGRHGAAGVFLLPSTWSEFVVNKLARIAAACPPRGIVTNVQDFVVNLQKGLNL